MKDSEVLKLVRRKIVEGIEKSEPETVYICLTVSSLERDDTISKEQSASLRERILALIKPYHNLKYYFMAQGFKLNDAQTAKHRLKWLDELIGKCLDDEGNRIN